jgi:hypothetical protein
MAKEKSTKYHVINRFESADHVLYQASDAELEKWATDPDCIEMEICAKALAERKAWRVRHEAALANKRRSLMADPFDPRTEVSADAKHIASRVVTHLWILFVLLPIVAFILLLGLGVIK